MPTSPVGSDADVGLTINSWEGAERSDAVKVVENGARLPDPLSRRDTPVGRLQVASGEEPRWHVAAAEVMWLPSSTSVPVELPFRQIRRVRVWATLLNE